MHLSREMRRFEVEDLSSRRGDRKRYPTKPYGTRRRLLCQNQATHRAARWIRVRASKLHGTNFWTRARRQSFCQRR